MATQEAEGLPGITLWDIARSLGRRESHAGQSDAGHSDARMDRADARMDRMEGRLDRLFPAVLGIGTALIGGFVAVLVKLFVG